MHTTQRPKGFPGNVERRALAATSSIVRDAATTKRLVPLLMGAALVTMPFDAASQVALTGRVAERDQRTVAIGVTAVADTGDPRNAAVAREASAPEAQATGLGAAVTTALAQALRVSPAKRRVTPTVAEGTLFFQADGVGDGTDSAVASGAFSVAAGANATASGESALAIGSDAVATATQATAVGFGAQAGGISSVALGDGALTTALAERAIAIGNGSVVTSSDGIALGFGSSVNFANGIAIGNQATINAADGIALGFGASVSSNGSMALGMISAASAANAVALGAGAVADRDNTVSVGAPGALRQVVNVAAGTQGTDAVNVDQLNSAIGTVTGGSPYFQADGLNDGSDDALVTGLNAVAIGANSVADEGNTVSVGSANAQRKLINLAAGTATTNAVNVGQLQSAGFTLDATGAVTTPAVIYTDPGRAQILLGGTGGTTISNLAAGIAASDAVNVGQLSVAIGDSVRYFKSSGLNDGTDDALVTGVNAVAIGASTVADRANSVSVGSSGALRQVVNVAAATQGTDAVNLDQLNSAIDGVVSGASPYFKASGPGDGSDGALAAGTDSVAAGRLAQANGASSTAIGANSSVAVGVAGATVLGAGSSATAANAVALGAGALADQADTVSVGTTAAHRRIVNVAAGVGQGDAVNVSQLQAVAALAGDALLWDAAADGGLGAFSAMHLTAGPHKIVDLRRGTLSATSEEAVNGSQLFNALDSVTQIFGGGSTMDTINNRATGPEYILSGTAFDDVGTALVFLDDRVNTLGSLTEPAVRYFKAEGRIDGTDDAVASGTRGVAAGSAALAGGSAAVAIGSTARAIGGVSVAVGSGSLASGPNDTAVGSNAQVLADDGTAVGANATVAADALQGSAFGASTSVTAPQGTALGFGSSVSGTGGVAVGAGSLADRGNAVSVGTSTTQRQIINVASGTAPTDAVNVGQLQSAGFALDAAGAVTTPAVTYTDPGRAQVLLGGAGGTTISNVAAGTQGLDAVNLDQLNSAIGGIVGGSPYFEAAGLNDGTDDARVSGLNAVAIGANSVADQDDTVSVGSATVQRRLVNLAAGTAAMDAVNVGQLQSAGFTLDAAGAVTTPGVIYTDIGRARILLGGAGGTAISNLAAGIASTDAVNVGQLSVAIGDSVRYFRSSGLNDGTDDAAVTALNAVALGANTVADRSNAVSVGAVGALRQVVNVAAGTQGTDAVNLDQLNNAISGVVGGASPYFEANGPADGSDNATAPGIDSVAAGRLSQANGANSAAFGAGSVAAGSDDTAIGGNARVGADQGTAVGTNSSVDIGAAGSTALGSGSSATAANAVALGAGSLANQADTVSIGAVGAERRVVNVAAGIGQTDAVNVSQLQAVASMAGDALTWDPAASQGSGAFSAMHLGTGPNKITRLARGTLSIDSEDAVNGSQLFTALDSITDILGGGASMDTIANRTTFPQYILSGLAFEDIGSALEFLDGRVGSLEGGGGVDNRFTAEGPSPSTSSGSGTVAAGSNAVATADNSVALGANSVADRASSVSVGSAGNERQVTNVAAGTLATDAVNVQQLQDTATVTLNQANTYTDQKVSGIVSIPMQAIEELRVEVNEEFRSTDRRINRQGAMNAAMVHMASSAANIQTPNRVSVGAGYAEGEEALSVGYQRQIKRNVSVSLGAAFSGSEQSAGVGLGVGW